MSMLAAPDQATRVEMPAPDWAWKITWRGKEFTDLDLTGQHLGVIVMLSGSDDWAQLSVEDALDKAKLEVVDGFMRLFNMVTAFVIVDRVPDWTPEDEALEPTVLALNEVRKASAEEIIGAFSVNR